MRPAQRHLSHLTDGSCVLAPNGRSVAGSAALRGDVGARESARRAGRFGVVAPRAAAPERHLPGDGGLGGHASRLPRCQSCHTGGLACTGPQLGAVGDVRASRRVVFECRLSVRPCHASCGCASFARVERCGEVLLLFPRTEFQVMTRSLPSWTGHDRAVDRMKTFGVQLLLPRRRGPGLGGPGTYRIYKTRVPGPCMPSYIVPNDCIRGPSARCA